MVLITICSVVVNSEARRQERQIAELQVSVEAREKFLKEKQARKLTNTIIVKMFVSYLPLIAFGIIKNVLKHRVSIDTMYAIYLSASTLVLLKGATSRYF